MVIALPQTNSAKQRIPQSAGVKNSIIAGDSIFTFFSKLSNLRHLDMSDSRCDRFKGGNPVNLQDVAKNDSAWCRMISRRIGNKQIDVRDINLDEYRYHSARKIEDSFKDPAIRKLRYLPYLEILNVANVKGLSGAAFNAFPSVKRLNTKGMEFTDSDLQSIGQLRSLEELNVSLSEEVT